MHGIVTDGEGKSVRQPTNSDSPGKKPLKWIGGFQTPNQACQSIEH